MQNVNYDYASSQTRYNEIVKIDGYEPRAADVTFESWAEQNPYQRMVW
jgi:hypothetical protein